ncbi:MAG: HEAT repeat domain-containing protein [Phycisphaerae bacterium]|nr:HEAT repeat domain-containing protein [Phycisphaerae bacterium]MDP7288098.1 HEAT repeat domain-containing protein [Phycisphaerae bacterium]
MMSTYDVSKKAVVGGAVAVVMLLVIVIGWLFDGSPDVMNGDDSERIAAIRQVAIDGGSDAGETLAKVVASKSSIKVRREAFSGMSHFLKPSHRELVRKTAKDPDVKLRELAVDTLGLYGDKAATTDLIAVVKKKDKEEQCVREAAIRGLAKCDDPRSVVALLDRAEHGANGQIKLLAMEKLLDKLGVRISRDRDPKDDKGWRDLIQRWKQSRRIRKAYEQAGERLVSRPQDLIGKDWHPERRGRR